MELLRLGRDDRLGPLGLAAPSAERLGHDRLEVVDVVEVAAVELVDRRIEVAGYGEVDEQQRPSSPRARNRRRVEHDDLRARRGDDDVDRGELTLDLGRVGLAVGCERDRRAARAEVPPRTLADLARAEQQHAAAVELAEHLLRKGGGRGRVDELLVFNA